MTSPVHQLIGKFTAGELTAAKTKMEGKMFFIDQEFPNYTKVHEIIEQYEQSTGYRLSITYSKKREDRDDLQFSYKLFRCKKSGNMKSRGRGIRNKL